MSEPHPVSDLLCTIAVALLCLSLGVLAYLAMVPPEPVEWADYVSGGGL